MLKINKIILIDVLANHPKIEDDDEIQSITVVPKGIQVLGRCYDKEMKEQKIHLVISERECQKYGATVDKEGFKTRIR